MVVMTDFFNFLQAILREATAAKEAVTGSNFLLRSLARSRWADEAAILNIEKEYGPCVREECRRLFDENSKNGEPILVCRQGVDVKTLIIAFKSWEESSQLSLADVPIAERIATWLAEPSSLADVFPDDHTAISLLRAMGRGGMGTAFFRSHFDHGTLRGVSLGRLVAAPLQAPLIGRQDELARHRLLLARAIKSQRPYLLTGRSGTGRSAFLLHLIGQVEPSSDTRFLLLAPADFPLDRETATSAINQLAKVVRDQPDLVLIWEDFGQIVRHPFLHEIVNEHLWSVFRGGAAAVVIAGDRDAMKSSPLIEGIRSAELPPLDFESTIELIRLRLPKSDEKSAAKLARVLVTICQDHYPDTSFPGAAIHLLDGAMDLATETSPPHGLNQKLIQSFAASDLGLSPEVFGKDKKEFYQRLYSNLQSEIFGQDHVLRQLCRQLYRRALAPHREFPRGRFLLSGPPGTGKTQLAKALARHLGYGAHAFHMFSMSEYANDGARSRFTGSDPGYVGFKSTFTVFDAVSQTPSCVILLDEIDRAHSSIQDVLLAMLEGSARDGSGVLHRFSQVVFIMTTNLGQEEVEAQFRRENPDGTKDDDERAEFAGTISVTALRKVMLDRSTAGRDKAELFQFLTKLRTKIDEGLRSWETESSSFLTDSDLETQLRQLSLVNSTLAEERTLSGRNALDRAFLDRMDFIFAFLPLEKRHLRLILETTIASEQEVANRISDEALEEVLEKAAAAGESGRGIARRWGEIAGQTLGKDLNLQ